MLKQKNTERVIVVVKGITYYETIWTVTGELNKNDVTVGIYIYVRSLGGILYTIYV